MGATQVHGRDSILEMPFAQEKLAPRLRGRKYTFGDERGARLDIVFVIHLQDDNSRSTDGRSSNDDGTIPAKMPGPFHPAWIEEPSLLVGLWVDAAQIRPLVKIAVITGPAQVVGVRVAAMSLRDDMIGLKGRPIEFLRHLAILASILGAAPDEIAQGRRNAGHQRVFLARSDLRALD